MGNSESGLWQATNPEKQSYESVACANTPFDLVIIGGGFSGCSAALEAASMGASVCLLEAKTIGYGASGRNVGLVNNGLWLPPKEIADRIGSKHAAKLIRALSQSSNQVFKLIDRYEIKCEPVRSGTLNCAHSKDGLKNLQDRYFQGLELGSNLEMLSASETNIRTGTNVYHGSLYDSKAGTVQPLAYCKGLARAAKSMGAQIYENSPALAIQFSQGSWLIKAHCEIRAKAILLATNAYHSDIKTPFCPNYTPMYYSQWATEPLSQKHRKYILPNQEGCWDTAALMSSFRLDIQGRLIVGSVGNAKGWGAQVHNKWLKKKLKQLYPQLNSVNIEHTWSGAIALTQNRLPKIIEFGPKAYCVFGYSGRGIGPGTILGASSAKALLEGYIDILPLKPIKEYSESMLSTKANFYELGIVLSHMLKI